MRAGIWRDFGDDLATCGVDHVPSRTFEHRQVDHRTVGREGHAVAPPLVFSLPQQFVRFQVEAHQLFDRADVYAARVGVGADPFHVEWLPLGIGAGRRDAPHELMSLVDVEDQQAMAAVLEIIAHAGRRDVEQPPRALSLGGQAVA